MAGKLIHNTREIDSSIYWTLNVAKIKSLVMYAKANRIQKNLICIKMNATHVSMILFISVIHVCHWRPPFCFSFNFLELKVFNLKKIKPILP